METTAMTTPTPAALPVWDLEAAPVPGQQAAAVLTLPGGHVVLGGSLAPHVVRILWHMWVESALVASSSSAATAGITLSAAPAVERLSVSYGGQRYVVTRDDQHLYMVQTNERTE
jgi:hypothetical protein